MPGPQPLTSKDVGNRRGQSTLTPATEHTAANLSLQCLNALPPPTQPETLGIPSPTVRRQEPAGEEGRESPERSQGAPLLTWPSMHETGTAGKPHPSPTRPSGDCVDRALFIATIPISPRTKDIFVRVV